jgi:hypothetical protein
MVRGCQWGVPRIVHTIQSQYSMSMARIKRKQTGRVYTPLLETSGCVRQLFKPVRCTKKEKSLSS